MHNIAVVFLIVAYSHLQMLQPTVGGYYFCVTVASGIVPSLPSSIIHPLKLLGFSFLCCTRLKSLFFFVNKRNASYILLAGNNQYFFCLTVQLVTASTEYKVIMLTKAIGHSNLAMTFRHYKACVFATN